MKVKFVPQNVEFEIQPGQSVMHLAQDHDIYIKSVCKGVPSCAECRVRIVDGEHNVLPPASEELALIGTGHFIDRRRLSCQLKCFGDITVDMNEQIAKQSGLIGKKTKRQNVKDDRVEQSVAIRSEIEAEEVSDEVLSSQVSIENQPVHPQGHSDRGPREGGRGDQQGRGPGRDRNGDRNRDQNRDQNRSGGPRPGGDRGPRPPSNEARSGGPRPGGSGPNPSQAGAESAGGEGGQRKRRRRRGGRGRGPGGGQGGPSGTPSGSP